MARVIISESLKNEILKKFKHKSKKIFKLMYSLKENPKKGKPVGKVGEILIKELKYKSFRFYFLTDGFKLKILDFGELSDLLIKFVKMSDKKDQQKIINEIKDVLRRVGNNGFE
ncbi:MAG: hypothetical protein KKF68_02195 [Nanoarchaeota archaeon]|nr:hypothetical protein [Nanoarchaeota archaeon]